MQIYKKAILPKGFKANGVACGIKKSAKLDLALLYSQGPAKASCSFTTNKILAAPILVSQRHLKTNSSFRAIIANSGNANCFTGERGLKDAQETAHVLAKALGTRKEDALLASTGIIGKPLAVEKIKTAIPQLVQGLSRQGISKAKQAIMTTDTFPKELTVKFRCENQLLTICGIAKGSGMIAPNMACLKHGQEATMLSFILTDANLTQRAQDMALRMCVESSFNCISVDGCMSTNDTVILLANGASGSNLIDKGRYFNLFVKVLGKLCLELAKMIIKDGEGATKFIRIKVEEAKDQRQARVIALSIANSNLFKTAMYGENPNLGRIIASIGACGIDVSEKDLKVSLGPLNKEEIDIKVAVNRGRAACVVYTSDLTPEYVRINAEYN